MCVLGVASCSPSTAASPSATPLVTSPPSVQATPTAVQPSPTRTPTSPAGTGLCDPGAPNELTSRAISIGGSLRSYLVSYPDGFDGSTRLPLVLNLHGAGETATSQALQSDMASPAADRGYLLAFPSAYAEVWNFEDASDLDFLGSLIDSAVASGCVDGGRVFAAGKSQGGDLAGFMACRRPGTLAAVASVAVVNAFSGCDGFEPTSFLGFAGTADPIYQPDTGLSDDVPFSGDPADKPGPLVEEAAGWARLNGCGDEPATSDGPAGTQEVRFDCPEGVEVLYLLHNGGHTWPGSSDSVGPTVPDLNATGLVLDFFDQHL